MIKEANYYCSLCQKHRYVKIETDKHTSRISKSNNGLAQVSDIHFCADGLLSINNLHIDKHLSIRSFSLMEFPETKSKSMSTPGIPMPNQNFSSSTYRITSILDEGEGYRLILTNKSLNIIINVGEVSKEEIPEGKFESPQNNVIMEYYNSQTPLRKSNRAWFKELVGVLEELEPTRLGLFIEALRYVWKLNDQKPSKFEVDLLKKVLSSHNTTFRLLPHNYKDLRNITNKYGNDKKEIIDLFIQALKKKPSTNLQELQTVLEEDLVFIIYLAVVMEVSGVIEIIN